MKFFVMDPDDAKSEESSVELAIDCEEIEFRLSNSVKTAVLASTIASSLITFTMSVFIFLKRNTLVCLDFLFFCWGEQSRTNLHLIFFLRL